MLTEIPAAFIDHLVAQGIPRDRLEVLGSRPFGEYLALHARADVVLDTFPFNGGTTSCHALWMGVPVVTLAGETATSRGGASLLHAIGLEALVARSEDEYLDIAAGLAADRRGLAALRAGMRGRMRASALMDGARFARNLDAAYREMWRAWCAARPRGSFLGRLLGKMRT